MRTGYLIIKILSIAFVVLSCSEGKGSVNGNWTNAEKALLRKNIENSHILDKYSYDIKEKWIECYLKKCEDNFSSYTEANSSSNEPKARQLLVECSNEVFSNGSKKGNWSKIDKDRFRFELNKIATLNDFGDKKHMFIECYLSKCEYEFSSYFEGSNAIEKSNFLAQECAKEILNR